METYLEGTTSSSLAWMLYGLAVKGAYQLGLYVMNLKGILQIDREVRRRLWYWCVMNDRYMSVILYMVKCTNDKKIPERDLWTAPFDSLIPYETRGQPLSTI